jgi:hypothetical protein
MNDEFDPFDIENVRSPEAAAAEAALRADREARKRNGGMPPELETKLAAHKAKGEGKKSKRDEDWFVMISVRGIVDGAKALREKRFVVWLYVLYRVFKDKRLTVAIGNAVLKQWGVSKRTKIRALQDYERAGLFSVEWRDGKSPLVTVPERYRVWSAEG